MLVVGEILPVPISRSESISFVVGDFGSMCCARGMKRGREQTSSSHTLLWGNGGKIKKM